MADSATTHSSSHSDNIAVSACKLTDEGKYAFAGLAANILAEQFNRSEEK